MDEEKEYSFVGENVISAPNTDVPIKNRFLALSDSNDPTISGISSADASAVKTLYMRDQKERESYAKLGISKAESEQVGGTATTFSKDNILLANSTLTTLPEDQFEADEVQIFFDNRFNEESEDADNVNAVEDIEKKADNILLESNSGDKYSPTQKNDKYSASKATSVSLNLKSLSKGVEADNSGVVCEVFQIQKSNHDIHQVISDFNQVSVKHDGNHESTSGQAKETLSQQTYSQTKFGDESKVKNQTYAKASDKVCEGNHNELSDRVISNQYHFNAEECEYETSPKTKVDSPIAESPLQYAEEKEEESIQRGSSRWNLGCKDVTPSKYPKGARWGVQLSTVTNRPKWIESDVPLTANSMISAVTTLEPSISNSNCNESQPSISKEVVKCEEGLIPSNGTNVLKAISNADELETKTNVCAQGFVRPSIASTSHWNSQRSLGTGYTSLVRALSPNSSTTYKKKAFEKQPKVFSSYSNKMNTMSKHKMKSANGPVASRVLTIQNRLKSNRVVVKRDDRRETSGDGVLCPRKSKLTNPMFRLHLCTKYVIFCILGAQIETCILHTMKSKIK